MEVRVMSQLSLHAKLKFNRCKNVGLNLRMFLKVQGGLKVKIEIKRFSEIHSAEYVYDTNEENVSSILPE